MTQNEFNPYVGPRPFERKSEDSARFFGRSQETEEIVSLIFGHPVILVYAQSGAGKTSLFNASIAMKMEENDFDVLPLTRVGGVVPKGIAINKVKNLYIFNALLKIDSETDPETLLSTSLSTFLETHTRTVNEDGQPRPRVIIFDQFEELFTYTPEHWREQREGFFLQVIEALNADSLLRVVFVIREDFLAELDPYSRNLPERLRTRYRLERLGENAALRAIKDPLVNTQRKFASGVAEGLVKELLAMKTVDATGKTAEIEGQYVEPVQLQVICVTLWSSLEPDCIEIQQTHLKNFNVNDALSNFYKSAIESAARETGVPEADLRNWFEKTLVTPMGTRSTVFRGEDLTGGIGNSTIDFLESRHIIRAEFRAGARWYELTHDRLVEPILANNKAWVNRNTNLLQQGATLWEERGRPDGLLLRGEELRDAETWIKDHGEQLSFIERTYLEACRKLKAQEERERWRNRLLTLFSVVATIAMIVAVVFGVQSQGAKKEALRQKASADSSLATAQASDHEAKNQLIRSESLRLALQASTIMSGDNANPELGVLLGIRALQNMYVSQADNALVNGMNKLYAIKNFSGHTNSVRSVAFSPDGKYVLTGSADNTAKLWDAKTGKEILTFSGHTQIVHSVAFSPDGKYVLTGSADNTAKLWDAKTGKEILTFSGHTQIVRSVAFSSDGKYVLTGSADNTAKLWDVKTGREIWTLIGHSDIVYYSVAFSPDGKYILTGSDDQTAKLWDVTTGEEVRTFSGHIQPVYAVVFSPDGKYVLTGSGDTTAKLWDVTTGEEVRTFSGHTSSIFGVAFSPDGKYVLTGSADKTAKLWDAATGKEVRTFSGHSDFIIGVAFSSDGKYVLTGSEDRSARLWSASEVFVHRIFTGHSAEVYAAAFSPDGKYMLTGSNDATAKLWDVATGKEVRTFSGHTYYVKSVAFSPDGKYVLTGSGDTTAKLWDATTGKEVRTFSGHTSAIFGVVFSPDGKYILTGSYDKTAKLWDMITGKEIRTFSGHTKAVLAVAFSPDGKYVLTGSGDETAKLWDVTTGKEVRTFSGHTQIVYAVAFSPDGKHVLTGSIDATAKLWESETGTEIRTFKGHTDRIFSVAFSPDGKYVLTGSADHTAKLWDVTTGMEVRTLSGHSNFVQGVAISPDGLFIVTTSDDKTARLWDVDYHKTIELACSVLTRDFTSDERAKYDISDSDPTCPK